MPVRLRIVSLSILWLGVACLTVLAFAGVLSPQPLETTGRESLTLLQKTIGYKNEELEITFKTDVPPNELQAALSLDIGNRHAIVSALNLPGNLEKIIIDKERRLAFLANSFSGLQIIDISDPANLQILAALALPGKAWDVKLRDNLLFIAAANGGVHLIDITTINAPVIISTLDIDGYPILGLDLGDNTVYAKTGNKGLLIIDVSDTRHPFLVNKLNTDEGVWAVRVDKNRLYVTSGRDYLEIFDITNPTDPKTSGKLALPDRAWNIEIHDSTLYLPTRRSGLLIVDISSAEAAKLLPTQLEVSEYEYIDVKQNRAYLADRTGKISIVDISNPIAPEMVGSFDLPDRPRDLAISGHLAFVAAGRKGLQVIDTSTLMATDLIYNLKLPGYLRQFIFDNNYYYFATRSATEKSGLYVSVIGPDGNPGAPIAHLELDGDINDLLQNGHYLYLCTQQGNLIIIDVADPSTPSIVGKYHYSQNIRDLVASGHHLFLSDQQEGVFVVDIRSPLNPVLISYYPLKQAIRLAIDESYLYVSTRTNLHILDYSTPDGLVQVGNLEFPWPLREFMVINQLTVAGEQAYLAAGPAGLFSINILNPKSPRLEEVVNLEGDAHSIITDHETIFVVTRQGKLWLLNQNNEQQTTRYAVVDTVGIGYNMMSHDDRAIIANGIKGLTILPLPQKLDSAWNIKKTGRAGGSSTISIRIPPHVNPGIYNINLLYQNELKEFVGALQISDTEN